MIQDPLVRGLAEHAVTLAEFVNKPEVRLPLIALGLMAMAWPMRRFLRLRYKIKIWGKSKMSEKIWVSKNDAVREVRESDWGELKEPYVSETRSIIDTSAIFASLNQKYTVSGMSPERKAQKTFTIFLEATLRAFHRNNPKAFRQDKEGNDETELNALRAFLQEAMDQEVIEAIGHVPNIKVT